MPRKLRFYEQRYRENSGAKAKVSATKAEVRRVVQKWNRRISRNKAKLADGKQDIDDYKAEVRTIYSF